ncbi:hypothetical protein [Paenibacillus selenitireducens]|uniref:hypothetical protein n=1 Tax=Paenibacillus selenitireducens TaxID=1324314 RepID=UPI00117EDF02|nr:hypothetical protein [Paenibacillus selenitireducens]
MLLHRIIENFETEAEEMYIEFVDENEAPSYEDLELIEMDRKTVKKVRSSASLFAELFDPDTNYFYEFPFRKRIEVEGGYRVARRRGARLDEVNVYNLVVRFKNSRIDHSEARAFMYRPVKNNQEWIVLLPDNTMDTIDSEIGIFGRSAQLFAESGKLSSEITLDHINENLKLLNLHERCAQTLMHEYGHVLHWRIFDRLGTPYEDYLAYNWFIENNYAELIDGRVPNYFRLSDEKKLWMLKECLVEDYRISLNLDSENGMFILPGKYTFSADFRAPELLKDGVKIMRRMLQPAMENESMRRKTGSVPSESEMTDIALMRSILEASMDENWVPGQQRMTIEDHHAVSDRLLMKTIKNQVAITR